MKRIVCMMGVLAVVIAVALGSGRAGAEDQGASIKDLMGKLHKGAKSPFAQLKTQLKSESPDWKMIKDESKDLVTLGAGLSKFDPPKGEARAYKALAVNYYSHAKDLDVAVQKEDLGATKSAFSKLSASCKECHSAHKGQ